MSCQELEPNVGTCRVAIKKMRERAPDLLGDRQNMSFSIFPPHIHQNRKRHRNKTGKKQLKR